MGPITPKVWGPLPYRDQWTSFSWVSSLAQTSSYATGLFTAQISQQTMHVFFLFSVLDPHRLVISFIALIHIVCCLKIYLQYIKPCKWVLFSFWRCFQTNVIAIVIVITSNVIVIDYIVILLIRNRNRLHLWCNRLMSAENAVTWIFSRIAIMDVTLKNSPTVKVCPSFDKARLFLPAEVLQSMVAVWKGGIGFWPTAPAHRRSIVPRKKYYLRCSFSNCQLYRLLWP